MEKNSRYSKSECVNKDYYLEKKLSMYSLNAP